jgi:4-alpha-glucanotransferase
MSVHRALLCRLAGRAAISTEWRDVWGKAHAVPADSLAALLGAMDIPAHTEAQARDSLRRRTRPGELPKALVLDAGLNVRIALPPAAQARAWRLTLEDGEAFEGSIPADGATLSAPRLPDGYHRLEFVESGDGIELIAAPGTCYLPSDDALHDWGLATQLYGLRSGTQWGIGDFTDLGNIAAGVASQGGSLLGVNPLHALFPADPSRISPYSPSSRLFLNPLYIDVEAVPDLVECEAARALLATGEFGHRLARVRTAGLVDYPAVARLKTDMFRLLWRSFRERHLGTDPSARGAAFRQFQEKAGAALARFAQFHALQVDRIARDGFAWKHWPDGLQTADGADVAGFAADHEDEILYHQYLQWEADRQLCRAAKTANLRIGLYRDLAIGADPYGADTWSLPSSYITGASVGAPPDLLNRQGQNWGLTAYSPTALQADGFRPFIAALRANMRHAGALRIDHVMGLKQLYLVPEGVTADRGAYIRYPFEDMVRILALESRRHRCLVVGEDLGTVPHGFRTRMARANVLSCRVLMFERGAGDRFKAPSAYPMLAAASAGTHDLPPLAGWWRGADIEERDRLALYANGAAKHRDEVGRGLDRTRLRAALRRQGLLPETASDDDLIAAVHRFLARTPSALLLVQIEDLLGLETMVNLPGTIDQHPNWRRRVPVTIAELLADGRFTALSSLRAKPQGFPTEHRRHG